MDWSATCSGLCSPGTRLALLVFVFSALFALPMQTLAFPDFPMVGHKRGKVVVSGCGLRSAGARLALWGAKPQPTRLAASHYNLTLQGPAGQAPCWYLSTCAVVLVRNQHILLNLLGAFKEREGGECKTNGDFVPPFLGGHPSFHV